MTWADPRLTTTEHLLGATLEAVRPLTGGTHARAYGAVVNGVDVVVRFFPAGDKAVASELEALREISPLMSSFEVPELVAADAETGVIVTTRVRGAHPDPNLSAERLAVPLARALAQIHSLAPGGLSAPPLVVRGASALAEATRERWGELSSAARVLGHGDFWCGNALWDRDQLTGVVDWSGARAAAAGLDVAWCRQDLILLGSRHAAEVFLTAYLAERPLSGSILAWDLHAAAHAEGRVATWAPNYAGIGRSLLTGEILEQRFATWTSELLAAAND